MTADQPRPEKASERSGRSWLCLPPRRSFAAGRGRPRRPWQPSWRSGTTARFPEPGACELPASSSTRAKSRPRNSAASALVAQHVGPIFRFAAIHGHQPICSRRTRRAGRRFPSTRLLGCRQPAPARGRFVVGRHRRRSAAARRPARPRQPPARAGPSRKARRRRSPATNLAARPSWRAEIDAAARSRRPRQQRRRPRASSPAA